jgi:hypothetical protein
MIALATPALERVRGAPSVHDQIADYLAALLQLEHGRPRRCARMQPPGAAEKYKDIPKSATFTRADLRKHAAGVSTWSCTLDQVLKDADGNPLDSVTRAGVVEIDQGGREAVQRALEAAERLGLIAFAFVMEGKEHTGGHVWCLYAEPAPVADVAAQMRQVARAAGLPDTTEIWPQNQGIRAPFGYHRLNQTRGALLTQAGEIFELDQPAQLAEALATLQALRLNGAPPPVPKSAQSRPKIAQVSQPQTYVKSHRVLDLTRRQGGNLPIPPDEYRAILKDARAHIIANYGLVAELESWGADKTHDGYTCPCGAPHGKGTKITIAPGGRAGFNHSDNAQCKLPNKAGIDVTNVLMVRHGLNFDQLARKYAAHLWPEPQATKSRKKPQEPPPPDEAPEWQTEAAAQRRAHDAERKRQARQEAAQHLRDDILGRAAVDEDMPAQSRQLLDIHLLLVGQRGWHRASVARMAEIAGYGDRWVQRFNEYLVEQKYIKRAQPDPTSTAVWTLLGSEAERSTTPHTSVDRVIVSDAVSSERSPEYISSNDLDQTLELVSAPPSPAEPDMLDCWQWQADEHGADELAFLDAEPVVLPEPETPPAEPSVPPPGDGDYSTQEIHYVDGRIAWRLWDDRTNTLLGEYPTMDMAIAAIAVQSDPLPTLPDGAVGYADGAQFYAAGVPDLPKFDKSPEVVQLDPLVQAPPALSDPAYSAFIWRWKAAQQLHRSNAQRTRFKREAEAYMVDVSPEEAALRWDVVNRPASGGTGRRGARLTSSQAAGLPVAQYQALMFGGAP